MRRPQGTWREWALWLVSLGASLALGLGAIRWFAPSLLGGPSLVRVVQVDERVVPFYESVFRTVDRNTPSHMLSDPDVIMRARPFLREGPALGPTDVLGFRNRRIPVQPRVITIGDSQTYGTGVPVDAAWPHELARILGDPDLVYDMSTGSWGAVQYLEMWRAAKFFDPAAVVIAYYAGNDARDSFSAAYSIERFAFLRPDDSLGLEDLPPVEYPPRRRDTWWIQFGGGAPIGFTPKLRLSSNLDHPAVAAGWEIMARVAEQIAEEAADGGPRVLFTIVPSKERVFELAIRRGAAHPRQDFLDLVTGERAYSKDLAERIRSAGAVFVDVAPALESEATHAPTLYPVSADGHMRQRGHQIVAERILKDLTPLLEGSDLGAP